MSLCFPQTDHPSAAQWQLDKWLKKSRKKSTISEHYPTQSIPGCLPSPHTQRAPSPARCWDNNQEYSPSQSPIPSPQFNYSSNNSPLPSPGYSFCPSPSPFPSTCPSPSPSPRHSPIPSPVPSVCPSPCGSPRASRSPSPIPVARDPPRSPSPSLPPSRVRHYPEVPHSLNQTQPSLTTIPHRTKIRSWIAPLPNTDAKSKPTNSTHPLPPHPHKSKPRPTQDQDQNKSKASAVLNSNNSHSHKSRPKPNFHPSAKQLAEAPKAKHTLHCEQIQGSRSNHSSNHKPRPPIQPKSQHSPTRAKHLALTSRETNTGHSSHSQSTSKAASNSNPGLNSRSSPSLKPRATAPTSVHVNHSKTSQKKPQSKEREADQAHLTQAEGRKQERKEDRHRETQQGKQERKEDRRLAEEQLLRRPWIQSSEEDEEEEEDDGAKERQKRREETERRENRRSREQQHRREWQTVQPKQRLPTSVERHRLQDHSQHPGKTKKGGRSEEERESHPDPSPPPSRTPTPHTPSSSSSASSSSNSDSESEYQAQITKVPADSTSHKSLTKRGQQGPGRPDANRPKAVHPRVPTSGNPSEGQQSEGRQKLYTLVPFGRSDKATASSQRGLRNLVVQIDLCLLKRVPDSTINSTVKKPSSSSSSSSTKDKQRETMKHLYMPDTVTKDGKRKRKVDNMNIYFSSLLNVMCRFLKPCIYVCLCVYV